MSLPDVGHFGTATGHVSDGQRQEAFCKLSWWWWAGREAGQAFASYISRGFDNGFKWARANTLYYPKVPKRRVPVNFPLNPRFIPLARRALIEQGSLLNNALSLAHMPPLLHARRESSVSGTILSGMYQLGDCIGKGAFGQVYSGLNIETGEVVAFKQIRLANIPKSELGLIMVCQTG